MSSVIERSYCTDKQGFQASKYNIFWVLLTNNCYDSKKILTMEIKNDLFQTAFPDNVDAY